MQPLSALPLPPQQPHGQQAHGTSIGQPPPPAAGMTKTINHYLINDSWYHVDLPGYGYAKASKSSQGSWLGFTKDYFLRRDALVLVLLLVDASLPPQPLDLECADWLAGSEV